MVKSFIQDLLPLHALFVLLLYIIGTFFTVVILEYRLKNDKLKHTIAAFWSVALMALCAYYIPLLVLGSSKVTVTMKVVAILAGCGAQVGFWLIWFRKQFKAVVPALAIAFALTVVVALLAYAVFLAYVRALIPSGADILTGFLK